MKITIHLDGRQANILYAGQDISGNVRVETKDEIKMRGIRLEAHGSASVRFSEPHGDGRRYYSCAETYVDFRTYLTGSEINPETILTAGVHAFPFSLALPTNLPSSFEGEHGSIRYRLKAVVNRIMRLDDTTELPIIVIRTLDLNSEPEEVKRPIAIHYETPTVGCWVSLCCMRGTTDIELRRNKGCFVPGETMTLNGHVVNKSNTEISKTTINFMQETEYVVMTARGLTIALKHQYKTLGCIKRAQIESGGTDTWNDVTFTVPDVPASRLDGCDIINIFYYIQVKVNFGKGCCAHNEIRHRVTIGHTPLQGDHHQLSGAITTQPPLYTPPYPSATASVRE